jgi:hypothetical protein
MSKFFAHALSPGGLMGGPEPHTAPYDSRQTLNTGSQKPSAINRFFTRAFSQGGFMGASEPYIAITPKHHEHAPQLDKFEEAHVAGYSDEYLRRN